MMPIIDRELLDVKFGYWLLPIGYYFALWPTDSSMGPITNPNQSPVRDERHIKSPLA